jgi:deazaflavin-dependent oxidoreductase (nitroreductase family)
VKLPRGLARFNKRVVNRIQGVYAWVLPPWAVVLHQGRRSGRAYRTPVLAFRRDRTLIIALLYGDESEWLRNVRTGPRKVIRGGRTYELGPVRVTNTEATPELASLSPFGCAYCRLAATQAVFHIGDQLPGFGPRRRQRADLQQAVGRHASAG